MLWLSPIYPSPQDDNGYDISDYQDIDPLFGTLATFDELLAGVHARGMKLVMDLVVNHSSDEHPWFVESRSSAGTTRSATGTGGGRPARAWSPARPAPSRPTGARSSAARPGSTTRRPASTTCTCSPASSPTSTGRTREVREAVYAMMRWWLDRGVDGFRMDVINYISKDTGRCRTAGCPPAPRTRDGSAAYINGPRIHEFLQEMHREVFAGPRRAADRRRDARRHGRGGDRCSPTRTAREVDMVFQFDHVWVDRGADPWLLHPLQLTNLKAILGALAGRARRASAGTASTGTTTTSRGWSPASATTAAYRVASAKMLGTVLHLHRGTPYVYQGEELGMTNAPFAGDRRLPRHRGARPVRPGGRPGGPLARGRADRAAGPRPGQRPYADAVGRLAARRLHHRHAVAAGQPELRRDQRGRRGAPTRTRSTTTTAG